MSGGKTDPPWRVRRADRRAAPVRSRDSSERQGTRCVGCRRAGQQDIVHNPRRCRWARRITVDIDATADPTNGTQLVTKCRREHQLPLRHRANRPHNYRRCGSAPLGAEPDRRFVELTVDDSTSIRSRSYNTCSANRRRRTRRCSPAKLLRTLPAPCNRMRSSVRPSEFLGRIPLHNRKLRVPWKRTRCRRR